MIGNVVSRGNPLMEAILDRNLPYVPARNGWASTSSTANGCWPWPVPHGKTTTTSMLSGFLEDAGYNPGFLVGGVPQNFSISARLTPSDFFVIEADEYDTAFFDKRSKFVHYRPRTAILNNLRVRSRRHLPGSCRYRDAIPSSGAHGAGRSRILVNGVEPALARVLGAAAGAKSSNSALGTGRAMRRRRPRRT